MEKNWADEESDSDGSYVAGESDKVQSPTTAALKEREQDSKNPQHYDRNKNQNSGENYNRGYNNYNNDGYNDNNNQRYQNRNSQGYNNNYNNYNRRDDQRGFQQRDNQRGNNQGYQQRGDQRGEQRGRQGYQQRDDQQRNYQGNQGQQKRYDRQNYNINNSGNFNQGNRNNRYHERRGNDNSGNSTIGDRDRTPSIDHEQQVKRDEPDKPPSPPSRPILKLAPRTKPIEEIGKVEASTSIFGEAKPLDTDALQQKKEEEALKLKEESENALKMNLEIIPPKITIVRRETGKEGLPKKEETPTPSNVIEETSKDTNQKIFGLEIIAPPQPPTQTKDEFNKNKRIDRAKREKRITKGGKEKKQERHERGDRKVVDEKSVNQVNKALAEASISNNSSKPRQRDRQSRGPNSSSTDKSTEKVETDNIIVDSEKAVPDDGFTVVKKNTPKASKVQEIEQSKKTVKGRKGPPAAAERDRERDRGRGQNKQKDRDMKERNGGKDFKPRKDRKGGGPPASNQKGSDTGENSKKQSHTTISERFTAVHDSAKKNEGKEKNKFAKLHESDDD